MKTLDGGLRLAVQPMPDSPVTSVHLWFDAGSVDEDPAEAGVAHFVEHMLFKGTARRGVGRAAAEIEGQGGDLNAWTSTDETCLHATLEASAVGEALDVVLDMARDSLIDAAELEREKQVVLEEIRGYEEDPDSVIADRMQALLFGDHPYGRPVIGYPKTVQQLHRPQLEAFWRRHYHPGRAVLAVAGPVDLPDLEVKLAPWLAAWPAGRARVAPPPPVHALESRIEKIDHDFGSIAVQIAWPGPPIGHPDVPALEVLASALGQGAASRLTLVLDLEHGVASHTSMDVHTMLHGGVITASFQCGETVDAVRYAVGELIRAAHGGLAGTAVARARDGLLMDLLFSTEATEGLCAELAWSVARTGDPHERERFRRQVAAVTSADVHRVAATWLRPEAMRLVFVDRDLDQRKIRAAVAAAGRAVPRPRSRPTGAEPELHRLGAVRVALLPDRSEVAAIRVLGVGGQLQEEARTAGMSEAWSRMAFRGAGDRTAAAFAEHVDALGVYADSTASRSTIGLGMTLPAANVIEATELLGDMLLDPRMDPDDWHNVREEMSDELGAMEDRPSMVASERLWRALYPDHPWRLPTFGTDPTLDRITPRGLLRFHRAALTADNLVIAAVGGFDPDALLAALAPIVAELPPVASLPAHPPGRSPMASVRPAHAGRDQATVLLGVRGVAIEDPDRTPLAVASHLLDSQSGRLFLQLREARGLAYGMWAHSEVGVGGGAFSAGLSTDPARVGEAVRALRHELVRLAEEGPDEGELERTRRMISGQAAMRHQRVTGRAADLSWSLRFDQPYGLPALRERLAAVTPERITAALRRIGLHDPVKVVVLPRAG